MKSVKIFCTQTQSGSHSMWIFYLNIESGEIGVWCSAGSLKRCSAFYLASRFRRWCIQTVCPGTHTHRHSLTHMYKKCMKSMAILAPIIRFVLFFCPPIWWENSFDLFNLEHGNNFTPFVHITSEQTRSRNMYFTHTYNLHMNFILLCMKCILFCII